MFKRLKAIKDLLWAAAIGLALLFLLIGLIAASFTSYHGDRNYPTMDLRSGQEKKEEKADSPSGAAVVTAGLKPDGTLHPLAKTDDAGESYLASVTLLCDSSFVALRGAGLSEIVVWSSETGSLPMGAPEEWKIRYPGDGSLISPSSAALIAKPAFFVLAVGSDEAAGLNKERFTEKYTALLRGISKACPDAKIACLTLCSVTDAYQEENGMTPEKAEEINGWIREICINTGAFFGDLSDTLCENGRLRAEYADGSGRALNSAGLRELLNYLRDHSLNDQ